MGWGNNKLIGILIELIYTKNKKFISGISVVKYGRIERAVNFFCIFLAIDLEKLYI